MVDRLDAMLGEPAGFFAPDVREQRLEVGMLDLLSEDRIQFAVDVTSVQGPL